MPFWWRLFPFCLVNGFHSFSQFVFHSFFPSSRGAARSQHRCAGSPQEADEYRPFQNTAVWGSGRKHIGRKTKPATIIRLQIFFKSFFKLSTKKQTCVYNIHPQEKIHRYRSFRVCLVFHGGGEEVITWTFGEHIFFEPQDTEYDPINPIKNIEKYIKRWIGVTRILRINNLHEIVRRRLGVFDFWPRPPTTRAPARLLCRNTSQKAQVL